ncbi:endothelin precursor [Moosepox virus GoldyGopher14]|nr:endothelin precursor [Moosepox virus GoldyGopher14]
MDKKMFNIILLVSSSLILCYCDDNYISFLGDEKIYTPEDSHIPHIRIRRCSCSSLEDKECLYFCSLDAVW